MCVLLNTTCRITLYLPPSDSPLALSSRRPRISFDRTYDRSITFSKSCVERNEGGGNIYPRRRRGARAGTVTKALFSRTGPGLFSSLRSNSIGDMGKYLRSAASYNIRPIRFTSSRVIPVLHDNQSSQKFGIGGRQVVHRDITSTAIPGKEENNRDHEKLGVAAALFATYFSVMFQTQS